jgi:ATPase subunit of ABC transporter with duplicated ATPase domains
MLTIRDLKKSHGGNVLFENAALQVNYGERVALVGPNGAGKSTIFSIILGRDQPDFGTVERDAWTMVGFLPQEAEAVGDETVLDIATGRAGDLAALDRTAELPAGNDGMKLCLAINYGARAEIVEAARRLAREVRAGSLDPEAIDEERFAAALDTAGMSDPDLLIRTAGEMRVSNFLLWQISYAELWVTDAAWPDFDEGQLDAALASYASRERRFGGLGKP